MPCPPRSRLCIAPLALLAGSLLWLSPAVSQTPQHAQVADSAVRWVPLALRQDSTPLAQLAAATRAARREGRTPIVEIGASWCGPCHLLEDSVLRKPAMRAIMQHMYVISLDLDVWMQSLLQLGFDAGTGIPRVVVIDSTGRPVGDPWRPRDVPDSLTEKLGNEGAWRETVTALFTRAQRLYQQPPSAGNAGNASKPKSP